MIRLSRFRLILVLAIGLIQSLPVRATGTVSNVTIDRMTMDNAHNEKLFVKVSSAVSTPAGCHIHSHWNFVLDTSTTLGTQMYAILIKLYTENTSVTLMGSSTCGVFGGIETLRRNDLL